VKLQENALRVTLGRSRRQSSQEDALVVALRRRVVQKEALQVVGTNKTSISHFAQSLETTNATLKQKFSCIYLLRILDPKFHVK
jgi:hypothetical protein